MTTRQTIAASATTIVLVVAMAAMSQLPLSDDPSSAFVRLSWRTEPIRVEECRALTEEELAEVPAHMRRSEECTGYFVDYEVRVLLDDRGTVVDTVAPSGLRRDRPIYVLRDLPVPPGRHSVAVTFSALVPDDYEPEDGPVTLEWSGEMELDPGEVGLVTVDETGRSLIRAGEDPSGGD